MPKPLRFLAAAVALIVVIVAPVFAFIGLVELVADRLLLQEGITWPYLLIFGAPAAMLLMLLALRRLYPRHFS
ncbi:MAG TPA: hypothetical protein VL426_00285 [Candidatus Binatia bacterium]|nr:hypothetical protein [Candidatus Binatia bacterium]